MASATPPVPRVLFFSDRDVAMMAEAIKRHHGTYAAMIADFFANEQALLGDEVRAEAWARVVIRLNYEGYQPPPVC